MNECVRKWRSLLSFTAWPHVLGGPEAREGETIGCKVSKIGRVDYWRKFLTGLRACLIYRRLIPPATELGGYSWNPRSGCSVVRVCAQLCAVNCVFCQVLQVQTLPPLIFFSSFLKNEIIFLQKIQWNSDVEPQTSFWARSLLFILKLAGLGVERVGQNASSGRIGFRRFGLESAWQNAGSGLNCGLIEKCMKNILHFCKRGHQRLLS